MERELQYLYDFLKDEFYHYPNLSIRFSPSIKVPGVTVKSETREFFFDVQWIFSGDLKQVQILANLVKDHLDLNSKTPL